MVFVKLSMIAAASLKSVAFALVMSCVLARRSPAFCVMGDATAELATPVPVALPVAIALR